MVKLITIGQYPNSNQWLHLMLLKFQITSPVEDNLIMNKKKQMIRTLLYNHNKDLMILEMVFNPMLLHK